MSERIKETGDVHDEGKIVEGMKMGGHRLYIRVYEEVEPRGE